MLQLNIFFNTLIVHNMGQFTDQLKNYLENTSPEQQEKDWFDICCKVEGIDPNDPSAKKKLKKIERKREWAPIWQMFKEMFSLVAGAQLIMCSCLPLVNGNYILFVILHTLGFCFIGWRLWMEREKL